MTSPAPRRILVGFDGSDDSVAALQYAADEAAASDATLRIVFAVDDTVLNSAWGIVFDVTAAREDGEKTLSRARELAHERGVPLDAIIAEIALGQPPAVLSRISESASLVVVGRRAESGEHSMFVGSTAVGLAGTTSCPAVLVSALNRPPATPHGVVGVGLDPGAHGLLAVEWALKRASRLGSRVRVVTVVRQPQSRLFGASSGPSAEQRERAMADVRTRVSAELDAMAEQVPGVEVEVDFRYGSPVDELVALSGEVDMLIVGVHPRFPTYSIGGVVRALMTHAACPLGLIRHK